MSRTSVILPPPLRQRLIFASQRKRKPISSVIRELLDKALAIEEDQNLDRVYQAMDKIKGIAQSGDPTASTSIDEILYGENGVWRGSGE